MKNYKFKINILILTILLAVFLAACGGNSQNQESDAEDTAAVVEEASQTETSNNAADIVEEPVEEVDSAPSGKLLIWLQQANQDVWEQTVLPEFQEKYPNVELEFVNFGPEEVAAQVGLAIQGGTGGPDLGVTQYRDLQSLIELGGIMDITTFMQPYASDFDPDILAYCETEGAIYCVPWDIGPTVTYYRRDIFEAAGLASDPDSVSEMVATWDAYLETCLTIKEETGLPCFPQNKANNLGLMVIDMLWQQGIGFFDENGQVKLDDPAVVAAVEKLGAFWEAEVTTDSLDWTDPWYAELASDIDNADTPPVATLVYPAWMGNFFKTWIAAEQEGNWGVALMPAWEEGSARASMGGGSAYFIPADSSNPEAAWALIEYMNLDVENQVAQYAYSDYFPALTSSYNDPIFSEGDPYFGGQTMRATYAEVAQNVPYAFIYDSEYYNTAAGALSTAIQNYALGNMSAEEALQEAADAVRLETGTP
ncbi:MAG: extracellular solute-binding protein [Chloroflexi bacterium]|nr:MAG: extracellular solute-binding protein [Chloroflexota bacterium]